MADQVIKGKGEGMMVKEATCSYEAKRSSKLLKVKKFEDTEATVTGHTAGTGKYVGLCGALEVRGDDGTEFKVGSGLSDEQRRRPPKIGTRITYK